MKGATVTRADLCEAVHEEVGLTRQDCGELVERVLELVRESGQTVSALVPDAYAIVPDAAAVPVVLQTLQALRAQGVSVQMHASAGSGAEGMGSMKSQFKKADASGARFALIFGETELASGCVAVKPLRAGKAEAASEQSLCKLNEAATWAAILRG